MGPGREVQWWCWNCRLEGCFVTSKVCIFTHYNFFLLWSFSFLRWSNFLSLQRWHVKRFRVSFFFPSNSMNENYFFLRPMSTQCYHQFTRTYILVSNTPRVQLNIHSPWRRHHFNHHCLDLIFHPLSLTCSIIFKRFSSTLTLHCLLRSSFRLRLSIERL